MNLRQKIKQAKKELKLIVGENPRDSWGIFSSFNRRTELQTIINYKRNINQYSNNDESILKDKKLTYMELSCGLDKLCVAKNDNGMPLSKEQQEGFTEGAAVAILKHVHVIYERYKDNDKLPDDFHVIYGLYSSADKTKSKRLVKKLYIYQFKGSKNLYVIEDNKWVLFGKNRDQAM